MIFCRKSSLGISTTCTTNLIQLMIYISLLKLTLSDRIICKYYSVDRGESAVTPVQCESEFLIRRNESR